MDAITRQSDILAAAERRTRNTANAFDLLHDAMRKAGLSVSLTPEGVVVVIKCSHCERTDDLRKCSTANHENRYLCPGCRKIEDRREDCAGEHVHDRNVERLQRENRDE